MGLGLAAVKAEIDTCSGHKVDYSLTGSAVVTEDNLSALSTFQQHISPSFTMAVIKLPEDNCRLLAARHRRCALRQQTTSDLNLLSNLLELVVIVKRSAPRAQVSKRLELRQRVKSSKVTANDDEKDKEAFGSCWQQFHSCGIWHESRRRRGALP